MNYIPYFLLLLFLVSCKNEKSEVQPDIISKHQSPFGNDTVAVKLNKILYNGSLIREYSYSKGYLSEVKGLANFHTSTAKDSIKQLSSGILLRLNGILDTYETTVPKFYVAESGFVSDEIVKHSLLKFNASKNDSIQEVVENGYIAQRTGYAKYLFNKEGFIIKKEYSEKDVTTTAYVAYYIRDNQSNIVRSWLTKSSALKRVDDTKYEYDGHPNPFFKLGVDWQNNVSIFCMTPNNITRTTYTDEDGKIQDSSYSYEYLPNGYPKRVKAVTKSGDSPFLQTYALDFIY